MSLFFGQYGPKCWSCSTNKGSTARSLQRFSLLAIALHPLILLSMQHLPMGVAKRKKSANFSKLCCKVTESNHMVLHTLRSLPCRQYNVRSGTAISGSMSRLRDWAERLRVRPSTKKSGGQQAEDCHVVVREVPQRTPWGTNLHTGNCWRKSFGGGGGDLTAKAALYHIIH